LGSLLTSTQAPAHSLYPVLHAKPQLPLSHTAWACVTPVVHLLSHCPQWLALLPRSTHVLPHKLGVCVGQPGLQPLAEHTGVVAGHRTPHAPQWLGSVMSVSQPVSASPEQFAQPGAQAVGAKLHRPSAEQETAPDTCGRAVQLCPQLPQCWTSLGTQDEPHDSWPLGHEPEPAWGVGAPRPARVPGPAPALDRAPDAPPLPDKPPTLIAAPLDPETFRLPAPALLGSTPESVP
jgi:hypothetical protein